MADPRGPCATLQIDLAPHEIDQASLALTDDFPEAIPVHERELDALETYLGVLIDEMLQSRD
jgi:hypothetical protein